MDVSIIQPVREAFRDGQFVSKKMKTAPRGLFPGAAAGKCLFALTRQPLRRSGQPKAAAPDSCTRVASVPGVSSCIHGKPLPGNGAIVFSAHSAGIGRPWRGWWGWIEASERQVAEGLGTGRWQVGRAATGRGGGGCGAMATRGGGRRRNSGLTEGHREKTE
jgi:hypothetical protein